MDEMRVRRQSASHSALSVAGPPCELGQPRRTDAVHACDRPAATRVAPARRDPCTDRSGRPPGRHTDFECARGTLQSLLDARRSRDDPRPPVPWRIESYPVAGCYSGLPPIPGVAGQSQVPNPPPRASEPVIGVPESFELCAGWRCPAPARLYGVIILAMSPGAGAKPPPRVADARRVVDDHGQDDVAMLFRTAPNVQAVMFGRAVEHHASMPRPSSRDG